MFKRHKHIILVLITSLALSILSVYHWFNGGHILYFWDSFILLDIQKSWGYIFYSWYNGIFPGSAPVGGWSLIPYWLVITFAHKVFGSISFAEQLLYTGIAFTSLVSFYVLLSHLTEVIMGEVAKNPLLKIGNFIFAIFYAFNLYTFYYVYFMFNPDAFIIAFLPLNIFALLKIYPLSKIKDSDPGNKWKWIFLFFITLLAMTSGFASYVFLAQYFVWIVFYLLLYFFISKTKLISIKTLSLILFLLLVVLSQWWWFYSALLTFGLRYDIEAQIGTTVWFDAGLIESRLLNSIRILGVTLSLSNEFNWSKFYQNSWFTFPLFIFPLVIIYLLTKLEKLQSKSLVVYMLAIFLVSLFIVKFNNPPLASVMQYAFYNVPFFGAFRGAYHKAGLYYIFSYFVLSGIGFYYLNKLFIEKNKRFKSFILFSIITVTGIILTAPFFLFNKDNIRELDYTYNNKKYSLIAKTKVPPEYYDFKSFFSTMCLGKASVIIPRGGWISSADWPKYGLSYVGIDFIPQIINCEFMTTVVFDAKPEVSNQSLFFMLDQGDYKGVKNFLYQHQLGYLIIRKDHVPYSPTTWVYVNPERVASEIKKDPDFNNIYENDFLILYELKPLKKITNYGFALPANVVYIDSALTKNKDYALLAKHSPYAIGNMVVNEKDNLNRFRSRINNYISESICKDCDKLRPNSEEKKAERILTIHQDGMYNCQADIFDSETKVEQITIKDKAGNVNIISSPVKLPLLKGDYSIVIDYRVKHVFDMPLVEIKSDELIKVPLGKISQGDYRMTYKVDNKEFGVEGFLTIGELEGDVLRKRVFGREGDGVLFTDPVPFSNKKSSVQRLFNANEFTNYPYTLYFNSEKLRSAKGAARITDLTINKVVSDEIITFSCSMGSMVDNNQNTQGIKVKQISPVFYTVTLPREFENGFLTFNKSFDSDWYAYTVINGKKKIFDHQISGYANAWYIDSRPDGEIKIEYKRQNIIEKNAIASLLAFFAFFLLYLKLVRVKKPKKNKK